MIRKIRENGRAMFLILLLVATIFAASISISIAWYSNNTRSDTSITGIIHGLYFERGTGTENDPYVIARPIQLYYFSWLQYLGYFNTVDDNGIVQQVYFEVADDFGKIIDMEGFVIPPVGTVDYPFIGNFNGGDMLITNLTVLANEKDSYSNAPSLVDDEIGVQIVGFFGVIGATNQNGKVTIDGVEYLYDSNVVSVHNFMLDNITLKSTAPKDGKTLVGIAAGYVNGNVSDIAVGNATLEVSDGVTPLATGTESISDYTIVGYCTEQYKDSFSVIDVEITDPDTKIETPEEGDDSGQGAGWGGSIDMQGMYNILSAIYDSAYNPNYVSSEYVTIDYTNLDAEGSPAITRTETESNESGFRIYDSGSGGSFVFSTYNDSQNTKQYLYLHGEDTYNINNGKTTYTETIKYVDVTLIKNGEYYLGADEGVIFTTTDAANAAAWIFSGNYIYTVIGETTYYLNRNGTTQLALSTSTNNRTSWANNSGAYYCTVNNTRYYIECDDNGNWRLSTEGSTTYTYYLISDGDGHYLNLNDSAEIAVGNSAESATRWQFANNGDNPSGNMSTVINSTTYYLNPTRSGNTYSLQISDSSNGNVSWSNNNGALYYSWNNGRNTRYLGYNNNTWRLINQQRTLSIEPEEITVTNTVADFALELINAQVKRSETETARENVSVDVPDTWFPLSMEENPDGSYSVANSNTGYLVSGSDFKNTDYPHRSGNIRVSYYNKTGGTNNISQSISNGRLNQASIYSISYFSNGTFATINSAENAISKFGFEKYEKSFNTIDEIVAESTYVYGLHFMDATIDKNSYITIDGAIINKGGTTVPNPIQNYQLPRNAISFNLAQPGFINFFAGTYFPDNSSFFSLYKIERESDNATLKDIKEIIEIYALVSTNGTADRSDDKIDKSVPYIYKYSDGSFSGEFLTDFDNAYEYVEIFDTSWLKSPSSLNDNSVYYFEIPVNEGEYALGSVEGSNGAYLLYLDLAAFAQELQQITTTEYVTTVKSTYEYPLGVQFVEGNAESYSSEGFDSSNSAAIRIIEPGSITVTRNDQTIMISPPTSGQIPIFVGDGMTLTDGINTLTLSPMEQKTVVERRVTVQLINLTTKKITTTITTTVQITENGITTTTERVDTVDENGVLTEGETTTVENAETLTPPDTAVITLHALPSGTDALTEIVYTLELNEPVVGNDGSSLVTVNTYDITLKSNEEGLAVSVTESADYAVNVNGVAVDGSAAGIEVMYDGTLTE